METFDTRGPISVRVELGVGDVRVVATERADTVVDIQPSNRTKDSDVAAAEQTRVDYADGILTVRAPKRWKAVGRLLGPGRPFGKYDSVDVRVEVPARSHLSVDAGLASLRCSGRLGECNYRLGAGDIDVGHVCGRLDLSTGSGSVRVDKVDGAAKVRNGNGDTWIGEAGGGLEVKAANGRIDVGRAEEAVTAKSANGDIHVGEVVRGVVVAHTACGNVDIGVRPGVAAWLDLQTSFGHVQNSLDASERPGAAEAVVELRARTSFGDITVRRAAAGEDGRGAA